MENIKTLMTAWVNLFQLMLPDAEPVTCGLISFIVLIVVSGAIPYMALIKSLNGDRKWIESDDRKKKVYPGKLGRKIYG